MSIDSKILFLSQDNHSQDHSMVWVGRDL